MISSETINLNTRAHSCELPPTNKSNEDKTDKPSASTPPPSNGLHIEKPVPKEVFLPPKSTLCKSIINPSAHVAQ